MTGFSIPDKLYGREKEKGILLESFRSISGGQGEILLVPGYSGVGKTSLVHELQQPANEGNGFFLGGKFDQYQQNSPYFAFKHAFKDLLRQINRLDDEQRQEFKKEILQATGNQGQILNNLVPELETFLGKQPPLDDINPQEARHRLAKVIIAFLQVFARPEHPLVLFIDDWQWADNASLQLLKQLEIGSALRYFLIIASYRDNEVNHGHPLISVIDDLKRERIPLKKLKVKNIKQADIQQIVEDTFKPSTENLKDLARLVYEITSGNPFFVRSFLGYLYDFNLLWFSVNENCWKWDVKAADESVLPADVVELFIIKLKRLNTKHRNVLSLAACLGNRFDIKTLSLISSYSEQECVALLTDSKAGEVVQPLYHNNDVENSDRKEIQFVFRHDRLQQAAFSLIDPDDLPHILLKTGRLLLNSLSGEDINARIFEITNNLNAGHFLINDDIEKQELIRLNIKAAAKAYAATAYNSSLLYYRKASEIIAGSIPAEQLWKEQHEMYMNLLKEQAVLEFLEGHHKEAEECLQTALDHCEKPIEKAEIYNIRIVQYTLLAKYPEAIAAGSAALAVLGIELPKENYQQARDREIEKVRDLVGKGECASIDELPEMKDPETLMACKILITMGPPCYRSHQKLWSVIVPKVVKLTLLFGNIPQTGYSHTAFGGLLIWVDEDFETAKKFRDVARRLMTHKFHSPSELSVFHLMAGSSNTHWFQHLKYGSREYTEAYETGLRSGNLQYAAYAFGHNMYCRFYQGIPLKDLISETKRSLDFSKKRHNQWAIDLLNGGLSIFDLLTGDNPLSEELEKFRDSSYLQEVVDHNNIQVHCIYNILKTFTFLFSGKLEEAKKISDETEPILYTVGSQGLLAWPEHVFARLLILTGLYQSRNRETQDEWLKDIKNIADKLGKWAENSPENFGHKYLLAKAELAKIEGRHADAMDLYEESIDKAKEEGFLQWEAMANERAHEFWHSLGKEQISFEYLQQAFLCYSRWGAGALMKELENKYRQCILEGLSNEEIMKPELKEFIASKHVKKLHTYAIQVQHSGLHAEALEQAEELAQATQRLRSEIAARKKTEEALRESEERFRSLFNNMGEGVALHEIIYNGDEPVNYRIIGVNSQYRSILGFHDREITGKLSTEVYKTKEPPYFDRFLKVAGTKESIYFETYYKDLDKHFAISVAPWQNGFATIFSDISERKKVESEVRIKNEELEKLNSQKDKFFSIIAHDLKSPFSSIVGMSELLGRKVDQNDLAGIKRFSDIIFESSQKAMELLSNLMEWSQSQTGRIAFNPEDFNLTEHIYKTISFFNGAAAEKSIRIFKALPTEIYVNADKAMISTVLRNLISNAVKFTSPGGKIVVSADVNEDEVRIGVKDNGVGMKQSEIKKLFRIDGNFSTRGTRNEKGTGLGLVLCKEFIDKHNGEIWVESKKDQGSAFYFTIPGKMEPESDKKQTMEKDISLDGSKVLIAEDEDFNYLLLEEFFQDFGINIIRANNGEEAVEICNRDPDIALILMDIRMPVMNGDVAAQKIKEFRPHLPIVAQTAYAAEQDKKEFEKIFDAYLTKPLSSKVLKENVMKFYPGRSQMM